MSDTVMTAERACLAQADLVLLAARLLSGPGRTDPAATDVSTRDLGSLAEAAVGEVGAAALVDVVRAALEARRRTEPELLQREHTRLFDGPVACPVNETAYVRRDKGVIISDICGFYRAFGFAPDGSTGEKADHLVCELEFVAVLLVMVAEAQRAGAHERAAVAHDAARTFLEEHLGEWLGPFCRRLLATTDLPCYVRMIDVLHALWDVLAGRFDLPGFAALDDDLETEAPEDAGTPYECDMTAADPSPLVPLTGPPGTTLPRAPDAGR
jgi:TorA maturation chaperone TorD